MNVSSVRIQDHKSFSGGLTKIPIYQESPTRMNQAGVRMTHPNLFISISQQRYLLIFGTYNKHTIIWTSGYRCFCFSLFQHLVNISAFNGTLSVCPWWKRLISIETLGPPIFHLPNSSQWIKKTWQISQRRLKHSSTIPSNPRRSQRCQQPRETTSGQALACFLFEKKKRYPVVTWTKTLGWLIHDGILMMEIIDIPL